MPMPVSQSTNSPRARILIADDHPVARQGLRALLTQNPEFEVCAEASTGHEAIQKTKATKPNVVLLDIGMPEMNGLEAVCALRRLRRPPEVLVWTHYDSEAMMAEALRAGASGYVLKSESAADLLTALDSVSRHRPFFSSPVWKLILKEYSDTCQRSGGLQPLSTQEARIVRLLAEGRTSREIAGAEELSVKAAEKTRTRIMEKLNLNSLSDVVHYAVRNNIIVA
jgi:DNA-binding NarL/FixJ family response regulator